MPDTIGELARQDLYPDERYMQPPQNAVGGLTPEDWMMSGQQPPAASYDYVPPQSWLQKAGDLARRDVATYQQGGVPAMMGQLAEDSSGEQDLAGGFGGNIKGVESKLGAIADLAPHAPPFYSAVEQAVQGAKQTTAPGQQWAGFLRNQPGVKPEELSSLKLGDLFDQTAVTKQDLLDHIAANKVQLGEVVKGGGVTQKFGTPEEQAAATARLEAAREALLRGPNPVGSPEWEAATVAYRDAENAMRDVVPGWGRAPGGGEFQVGGDTKFSQYTLPGGENYREMLLTLPQQMSKGEQRLNVINNRLDEISMMRASEHAAHPELRDEFDRLNAERLPLMDEYNRTASNNFKSSHFDEPNILAHIRTNDRVIDGKKTLFVEEVQSDWHQKGKRYGYQGAEPASWTSTGSEGVPDAPFKTTWPDLAMKRVIREAAEKGYDKVAWTPGSVQADRYDLSKQVSKINAYRVQNAGEPVLKDGQPQYRVQAHDKDGRLALDQYVVERDLPDTIGKDLADKIIKARDGAHDYSGLDLKVGGEGMKGFYDQILPAAVNKIVKKAGGRVGEGNINVTPPSSDAAGSGLQIRPAGGRYEVFDTNTGALEQRFDTLQEARDHLSGIREAERPRKVHTLDITPQLREMALKKGFPLFAAGGLVAGGAISGSKMGDLAKQDDYQ